MISPLVPQDVKTFLEGRIITIAGAVITPGSLLVGATIVVIATAAANLLAFSARRLLKARGSSTGVQFSVAKMVRYLGTALGLIVAINVMGFHLDALIAASAVLAVGIGFGLQNIAQNFISGLILLVEQPVRQGDFIRVGETLGVVDDIGLRATHIVTRDEVTIIVPNSALITAEVINHSRPTISLRIRVAVGVAYGTDLDRVKSVLLGVAANNKSVLTSPAPEVRFEDFADSAMALALLCWIPNAREDLRISSALRFAIEKAFREAGIEIPFPQRDVNVKSFVSR